MVPPYQIPINIFGGGGILSGSKPQLLANKSAWLSFGTWLTLKRTQDKKIIQNNWFILLKITSALFLKTHCDYTKFSHLMVRTTVFDLLLIFIYYLDFNLDCDLDVVRFFLFFINLKIFVVAFVQESCILCVISQQACLFLYLHVFRLNLYFTGLLFDIYPIGICKRETKRDNYLLSV